MTETAVEARRMFDIPPLPPTPCRYRDIAVEFRRQLVAIAMNDSAETIEEFSKGQPIGFTNLLGGNWDGSMARLFGPMEVPTDVVVDPSGHVAFVGVGSDALRSALERLKELGLR